MIKMDVGTIAEAKLKNSDLVQAFEAYRKQKVVPKVRGGPIIDTGVLRGHFHYSGEVIMPQKVRQFNFTTGKWE